MVDIIEKKAITQGSKGTAFEGLVYIADSTVRQTSKGSNFTMGTALSKTGSYGYKIWNSDTVTAGYESLNDNVYHVEGTVNEYRGEKSLIISTIHAQVVDVPLSEFESNVYSLEELTNEFRPLLSRNLSSDGLTIWKALLGTRKNEFFTEYAARKGGKNHDNVKHGLLAHSLKVTKVLELSWTMYNMSDRGLDKDLLFIGTSLHDLGKVIEYSEGSMSPIGLKVSHRSIATEILVENKQLVLDLKGEEWYYTLMSIFEQHHGEYEESPRTFYAMYVHSIDMFESSMAGLLTAHNNYKESGNTTEGVYHKGFFLS